MSDLYFEYYHALVKQNNYLPTEQIQKIGAKYNASHNEMALAYTRAQYVAGGQI